MFPQWMHYVNDETQSSDDATWREKLPNLGNLHTILLKVKCTNGATSGRAKTILDVVDNIEVIANGSEVLFSLYPEELEKWIEALHGFPLPGEETQAADDVQEMVFPIMFGLKQFDPNHFLPLNRFQKVELEVKYSPTIAADSGFATGTTTFDLMLLISPPNAPVSYNGTVVHRRLSTYTSVASGNEEIELPSASEILAIGNYCYEADVADGTDITKVILEDKANGKKLYEADWFDGVHLAGLLSKPTITHVAQLFLTNNEVWNSRIAYPVDYHFELVETPSAGDDEVDILHADAQAGDKFTFDLSNVDITAGSETITASTTDRKILAQVMGKNPSYFLPIPFGPHYEGMPLLKTQDYGRPTVVHTQGAAGGTVYTSIQELKRY
jgi:hypothetical protein